MDKPDKGMTLFMACIVLIIIAEVALLGAFVWRAVGWQLALGVTVVMSILLLFSCALCHAAAIGDNYDLDDWDEE